MSDTEAYTAAAADLEVLRALRVSLDSTDVEAEAIRKRRRELIMVLADAGVPRAELMAATGLSPAGLFKELDRARKERGK